MVKYLVLLLLFCCISCQPKDLNTNKSKIDKSNTEQPNLNRESEIQFGLNEANQLLELPLHCIANPLPYKSGIVLSDVSQLVLPKVHHPAFYGCFDWHSAVHGHWSIVYLLKNFPNLGKADEARKILNENLTKENIKTEIEYFDLNEYTKSFERTYGWAWLLKLAEELQTWDDSDAQLWYQNIKPLCELLSEKYIDYLPKLVYPIRVGEHSNTAFGLSFAYDYAKTVGNSKLAEMIEAKAISFYKNDAGCPITWEPSGYDFLSPCLQELDIMRKVLSAEEFNIWVKSFLPKLSDQSFTLDPAQVLDRTDGKLVHLDGLNFSRAWCLYPIAKLEEFEHLENIANQHVNFSMSKIIDDHYSGGHWLGSFVLYAISERGL